MQTNESISLSEVKEIASSMSLSTQKKEEILTTLQGAISENEWNKERLEAIVEAGGEAGVIAQLILNKKAENSENIKGLASRKALNASLKEELATRLALMASNPAVWIAGIVAVGIGLVALQKKFVKSMDECIEDLEEYNSEFENAKSETESLETELKDCTARLGELQQLADNGTISIIEQEELDRLKETNQELERNISIQQEKTRLSAIEGAKTADQTLNTRVGSYYAETIQYEGTTGSAYTVQASVLPQEELNYAISEYQKLEAEIDNLKQSYDNGNISVQDYEKQLSDLEAQQTKARTRASEMNDILSECDQSYTNLKNSGEELTATQTDNSNIVLKAISIYRDFLGLINGTDTTFEQLDTSDKSKTIKDKYASKTISLPNGQGSYTVQDKEISDWIDTLSDEDLTVLASINFSGEQTKESMQEALEYAKTHNSLEISDETTISTITSSVKQIATQLEPQFAKLGEAYKAIFTTDGFTLEDVDNSMLEGLRASFAEIEEEVGVAFDSTELESFFDTLTKGDSTADQVQQAFNDLATSYLYSTDTLANLNEETAEAIEKQLEELGVVNAHEVVYGTLNAETEALALQKQYLALYSNELISVTSAEAIGFLNEAGASETARKYLMLLTAQEQIFSNSDLNVTEKISALQELAQEYGDTALAASVAAKMEQASKSAATGGSYSFQDAFNDAKAEFEAAARTVEIDFSDIGTSGASKAGGDAGDAYVEAFEKELSELQDLRDRGVIDEKEYLDRLRALYIRYFADREEYLDEYNKYEREYLEGKIVPSSTVM